MISILNSARPVVFGLVHKTAVISLTPVVWSLSLLLKVSVSSFNFSFQGVCLSGLSSFQSVENECLLPPSSLDSRLSSSPILASSSLPLAAIPPSLTFPVPFFSSLIRLLARLPHRSLRRTKPNPSSKLKRPPPPTSSSSTRPPSPFLPLPPLLEPPFSRPKMDPLDKDQTWPSMTLLLLGR